MSDKQTILVVEDETPLLEAISRKLEISGFRVLPARSVKEVDHILSIEEITAIWLDHFLLGQEDGLDLVTKLKDDSKYKDLPIFVVSGHASDDNVSRYLKLGVERYFPKANYQLSQIIKELKDALGSYGQ